jgi:hypothetical protein
MHYFVYKFYLKPFHRQHKEHNKTNPHVRRKNAAAGVLHHKNAPFNGTHDGTFFFYVLSENLRVNAPCVQQALEFNKELIDAPKFC